MSYYVNIISMRAHGFKLLFAVCSIFCLQRVLYLICCVLYILLAVCFIFCLQRVIYFVCSVLYILFAAYFIFYLQCVVHFACSVLYILFAVHSILFAVRYFYGSIFCLQCTLIVFCL